MDWNAIFTEGLINQWNEAAVRWFCSLMGYGDVGVCNSMIVYHTFGWMLPFGVLAIALLLGARVVDLVMEFGRGMFGHEWDYAYGVGWNKEPGREFDDDLMGDFTGDLSVYELDDEVLFPDDVLWANRDVGYDGRV
jgi:hypothetical protein